MSAPARSRLQLDERRAQLLALGLRLFSERPYDGISIGEIAKEAGVSKGLLYHYFGSKRAFYVATVKEAASMLISRIEPDPSLSEGERLGAGLSAYLDFVEERAAAYEALMAGGLGADPEVAAILDEAREEIVARAMRELGFKEPRPIFRAAFRSWIGAVEAASLSWLREPDLSRQTLEQMLLAKAGASMLIALKLDPEAEISLAALASPELLSYFIAK